MNNLSQLLGDKANDAYVAARSGDYQLLLGAGASFGSKNARQRPLPMAASLITMLQEKFPAALIEDGNSLQRAYQRAVYEVGKNEVWKYFKEVFGGATHEEWFTHLAGLPWGRVWTLNIDDAFERAFAQSRRQRVTRLRVIDWTDEFSESDDMQIVHLHGSIIEPKPTPLVFSFSDYANAIARTPVWDQMLRGSVVTKPFIIIGAKGLDEPDLEATLVASRPSSRAPSIIVDPHVTPGQRREMEYLGYIVFEGTAEDFTRQWSTLVGLDSAALATLYETTAVSIPQFSELRLEDSVIPTRNHDFLGGSKPQWADARMGSIAEFDWMSRVLRESRAWVRDLQRKSALHVIFSDRLAGLSAGLLFIAAELRESAATVLVFDRVAKFNKKRVLDFCAGRGPVVIICDSSHEFTMFFDELLTDAQNETDCSILVIFGETTLHELQVDNHFRSGTVPRSTTIVYSRRNAADARQIESLLNRRGRLGRLEQLPPAARRAHFRDRDIFGAMGEVEGAPGFQNRLAVELRSLSKEWHADLLMMLAIASAGNHQVGISEAAIGVGVGADQLLNDISEHSALNALVEVAGDLMYARQRSAALKQMFDRDEADARLASLSRVTRNLGALATSASLKERNRPASLVGGLMQARVLRNAFKGANIDAYYDSLLPVFGSWNARFWEQRAINAKHEGDWGPAESWASRAVTIKDDAYTQTTLGTILLNKSAVSLEYGDQTWMDLYRRGRDHLDKALYIDVGNRVAAISYLENAMNLLRSATRGASSMNESDELAVIRADWSAHYASVQLVGGVDDSARRRASELGREFEAQYGVLSGLSLGSAEDSPKPSTRRREAHEQQQNRSGRNRRRRARRNRPSD